MPGGKAARISQSDARAEDAVGLAYMIFTTE
jgi:hypothetical protein